MNAVQTAPKQLRADSKISSQGRVRRGACPTRREEGEYVDVFNRRGTPQGGMDRRTNPGVIFESALIMKGLCSLFLFSLPVCISALHVNSAHAVSGDSERGEEKERIILQGDEKEVKTSKVDEIKRTRSRARRRRKSAASGQRSRTSPRGRVLHIAEGPYSGVVPGTKNPPPGKQPGGASRCLLLWPGFQMSSGGQGAVFLQFNKRAEMEKSSGKLRLDLFFPGCRIPLRNNRRRLVTRYFPTVVNFLHARNTRKGVHVGIHLKRESTATYRWITENEHEFLYLIFDGDSGPVESSRQPEE